MLEDNKKDEFQKKNEKRKKKYLMKPNRSVVVDDFVEEFEVAPDKHEKKKKKKKVIEDKIKANAEGCNGGILSRRNNEPTDDEESKGSSDKTKNKKRKMEGDISALAMDEKELRKKVKMSLSTEDNDTIEEDVRGMPFVTPSSTVKAKRDQKGNSRTQRPSSNETVLEKIKDQAFRVAEDERVIEKIKEQAIEAAEVNERNESPMMGKEGQAGTSVVSNSKKNKKNVKDDPKTSSKEKKKRRVTFSVEVEVFPPSNDNLVWGKRFTPEEDQKIKDAIEQYIVTHQLGEEGQHMILHCNQYPQVKKCWKEIGACLPYRPYSAIYHRGHTLLERSEERKWDPEDKDMIKRHYATHGADWKTLAVQLGRHRFHVKDCWRRIRSDYKRGAWSQDEYQALFDLVNLDLRIKAFEEKKTKHGMLKDNISWEAISNKIKTRQDANCCLKWYNQLASPLTKEGLWADSDDYRLLDALQKVDACCIEDVDWDNLLEHRSAEVCRKRWNQMTKYIGGYRDKSFIEQVEVLSKRYPAEMIGYRK